MTPAELEVQQRARRIGIALDALKEIELAVTRDTNSGMWSLSTLELQQNRIGQAVSIYCTYVVAE